MLLIPSCYIFLFFLRFLKLNLTYFFQSSNMDTYLLIIFSFIIDMALLWLIPIPLPLVAFYQSFPTFWSSTADRAREKEMKSHVLLSISHPIPTSAAVRGYVYRTRIDYLGRKLQEVLWGLPEPEKLLNSLLLHLPPRPPGLSACFSFAWPLELCSLASLSPAVPYLLPP